MASKRPQSEMHSREYFRKIFSEAAKRDPVRYKRATAELGGKTVHVIIEAAKDEQFYLVSGRQGTPNVTARTANASVDITLRIPPGTIRTILEGVETPVEAFFLGHLRARGRTRDLYAFHAFFLGLAEIAAVTPAIQDLIEAFQKAKEPS